MYHDLPLIRHRAFEGNSLYYLLRGLDKLRQLRQTYSGTDTDISDLSEGGGLRAPIDGMLRLVSHCQQPNSMFGERFLVYMGQRMLFIDIAQMANKPTYIKTQSAKHFVLDYSLDKLVNKLGLRRFSPASWQFIVSHKAAQKVHQYFTGKLKASLLSSPDRKVIISREKAMALRHWLGE